MDPLDVVLRTLRMKSSILSRSRFGEPWAVLTRGAASPILHAIVEGRCTLSLADERIPLSRGDVVMLPHGASHVMASDPTLDPTHVASLTPRDGVCIEHGGPGARCVIICGTFQLDHEGGGWLLGLLPRLVHMRPSDDVLQDWVDGTLRLLDAEITEAARGAPAMVTRLTDLLVVQALRKAAVGEGEVAGWLAAVRDDKVGKALALIHDDPAADWSAAELASRCGMSRSRFFARFSSLVGEPPARYLARWRAKAAADLLRRRDVSTAEAAEAVGYHSERAFSDAFRRHIGLSPSAYRRRVRQPDAQA